MLVKKAAQALTALLIIIALTASLTAGVAAAGIPKISVSRGGNMLKISPILLQDGRAYAPYDALFTALGATAAYDGNTEAITAVDGDTEIVYDIGMDLMTVTINGVEQWVYANPTPILDTSNGTVYISIRYAAQALGYVVGWDSGTRSIQLKSLEEIINECGATYTVMDKYLSYQKSLTETCHALDGTFDFSMDMGSLYSMPDEIMGEAIPFPEFTFNGTVSGLFDMDGEEMSMTLKTNFADLMEAFGADEALDDQSKALIDMFGDTEINLILNNKTGMIYMQSPLFEVLYDAPEDAWISMEAETNELFSTSSLMSDMNELSAINLTGMTAQYDSFKQYLADMLQADLLYDYGGDTLELLDSLNAIFSDQAMTKDGDNYMVSLEDVTEDYYGDITSTVFEMTFLFDGETFEGITISLSSSSTSYNYYSDTFEETTMVLSYSYSSDGKGSLSITAATNDTESLSLGMEFTYTESDQLPARSPASGSTVIPFDDLMANDAITPDDFSGLISA